MQIRITLFFRARSFQSSTQMIPFFCRKSQLSVQSKFVRLNTKHALHTFDIDCNLKIDTLTILCKQSEYGKDRKKENYHGFIYIYVKMLIRRSCDHFSIFRFCFIFFVYLSYWFFCNLLIYIYVYIFCNKMPSRKI